MFNAQPPLVAGHVPPIQRAAGRLRSVESYLASTTLHLIVLLALLLVMRSGEDAAPGPAASAARVEAVLFGDEGDGEGQGDGSPDGDDIPGDAAPHDASAAAQNDAPQQVETAVALDAPSDLLPAPAQKVASHTATQSANELDDLLTDAVRRSSGRAADGSMSGLGGDTSGSGAGRKGNGIEGPRRGGTRTGVFGVIARGGTFVYVFDRSGSMESHSGRPLAAAKEELLSSLSDLREVNQFQIIFYNERQRSFDAAGSPGRMVFATEQNQRLAEQFVRGIVADGGTEHLDALLMAVRMAPDVIFFLTDADEPQMTPRQLERVRNLNHGTSINTIEFGYGAKRSSRENFLAQIARENDGQYVYVDASGLGHPRK